MILPGLDLAAVLRLHLRDSVSLYRSAKGWQCNIKNRDGSYTVMIDPDPAKALRDAIEAAMIDYGSHSRIERMMKAPTHQDANPARHAPAI